MSDDTAIAPAPAGDLDDTAMQAAFEEFAAKKATGDPDPVVTPDNDDDNTPDDSATAATPAAAVTTPAPTPAPAAAAPAAAATDIWSSAPAELRAAHEAALADRDHRYTSDLGRQAAHQRRIQALEAELAQRTAAPAAPTPSSALPTPAASTSLRENPSIKKSLEDYPDVVGPLLDLIEPVVAENTQIRRELSSLTEDRTARVVASQEQALAAAHPDWEAACASRDFADWLETQPKAIKQIVERNGKQVVDAEEAIAMVGAFKAHFALTHPKPAAPVTTPVPPAAPTQLAARREAQLKAATTTPKGNVTAIPDGAPGGEGQAVFDHFVRKKAQKG